MQVVVAIPLYQLEHYDRGKTHTCQQFPLRLAWAVTVHHPAFAKDGRVSHVFNISAPSLLSWSAGAQVAGSDFVSCDLRRW
jgi:hypothetical protein